MDRNRVTVRYAKAFVELASGQGISDTCYSDMLVLFTALSGYRGFIETVFNPGLPCQKRIEYVTEVFEDKFHPLTLKFLELIFSKHREKFLIDICRNAIEMFRNMKGISSASLVTAHEIDEVLVGQIKSKFEKKIQREIDFTISVDQSLIGGFIFTVDGEQYDASIASRLSALKKQIQIK